MKKVIICFLLVLSGCATVGVTKSGDLRTLTIFTGSKSASFYSSNFNEKANSECPIGYDLIEATKTPSTLPKQVVDDYHFYWVIKCK